MTTEVATKEDHAAPTLYGKVVSVLTAEEIEAGKFDFPEMSAAAVPQPKPSYANVAEFMQRAGLSVAYDAFAFDILLRGYPGKTRLDDAASITLKVTLGRVGLKISKQALDEILIAMAEENATHPVRELFRRIESKWDGIERIETWLVDYCNADDTPFNRWLGRAIFLAIVRRVRRPGFPWKFVPVFEGAQGVGKSPVCAVLGLQRYHCDSLEIGSKPKEVLEQSGNVLVFEYGELSGMTNKEVETLKAFSSRTVDKARRAFERFTSEQPRQFIGIATTNRQDYNRDETGNTRMLPVTFNGSMDDTRRVDFLGMQQDILQLYAEAANLEHDAPNEWFYPTGAILDAAKALQKDREHVDAFDEALQKALGHLSGDGHYLPLDEALRACDLDPAYVNKRDARLHAGLRRALGKLGFKPMRRVLKHRERGGPDGAVVREQKVSGFGKGKIPHRLDTWLTYSPDHGTCGLTVSAWPGTIEVGDLPSSVEVAQAGRLSRLS